MELVSDLVRFEPRFRRELTPKTLASRSERWHCSFKSFSRVPQSNDRHVPMLPFNETVVIAQARQPLRGATQGPNEPKQTSAKRNLDNRKAPTEGLVLGAL